MPCDPTEKTRLYLEHRDESETQPTTPTTAWEVTLHQQSMWERGWMCGGLSNMQGLAAAKLKDPGSPDNFKYLSYSIWSLSDFKIHNLADNLFTL